MWIVIFNRNKSILGKIEKIEKMGKNGKNKKKVTYFPEFDSSRFKFTKISCMGDTSFGSTDDMKIFIWRNYTGIICREI